MSRIYVLQSPRMAAAAARMKADVNFLGAVDVQTADWLSDNHVFLRETWETGAVTAKQLQRLYHRLFPGDWLVMDGSLPDGLRKKAGMYARELGARVVIGLSGNGEAGSASSDDLIDVADGVDILVHAPNARWSGNPGTIVSLEAGDNLDAWVGAMALCLMNGLSLEQSRSFCQRAAAFEEELPWYDEVAYG
ncbi:1-phosphofructokinase family hexose kinase [Cohnella cholangitidis]|uniref:Uncharacterized protein n=1 Tax=Cohnella cholangitidis TaxID=2598458 RepID=A0A7G5C0C7_9BACL|nr:hypothetical protein [Cohnella cholangitidis]QMV42661.1 hypothetical protein FPL14_16805 [Cohnella cholangitidis]